MQREHTIVGVSEVLPYLVRCLVVVLQFNSIEIGQHWAAAELANFVRGNMYALRSTRFDASIPCSL